jgi:hypothetical protein
MIHEIRWGRETGQDTHDINVAMGTIQAQANAQPSSDFCLTVTLCKLTN